MVRARLIAVVLLVLGWLVEAPPALAAPQDGPAYECAATAYQDDARLGPATVPVLGVLGAQLRGYQRTGGQPVTQFLATYYDTDAGSWRYPPQDGYRLDMNGQPVRSVVTLPARAGVDRYGSEFGAFLAPAGSAYGARSIPPTNLNGASTNCNYYSYLVLRPFQVDAGPVAAWFGQPGGGTQYELDASLVTGAPSPLSVGWLVANDYLRRVRGVPPVCVRLC